MSLIFPVGNCFGIDGDGSLRDFPSSQFRDIKRRGAVVLLSVGSLGVNVDNGWLFLVSINTATPRTQLVACRIQESHSLLLISPTGIS